jgi:hypothetical protein
MMFSDVEDVKNIRLTFFDDRDQPMVRQCI